MHDQRNIGCISNSGNPRQIQFWLCQIYSMGCTKSYRKTVNTGFFYKFFCYLRVRINIVQILIIIFAIRIAPFSMHDFRCKNVSQFRLYTGSHSMSDFYDLLCLFYVFFKTFCRSIIHHRCKSKTKSLYTSLQCASMIQVKRYRNFCSFCVIEHHRADLFQVNHIIVTLSML